MDRIIQLPTRVKYRKQEVCHHTDWFVGTHTFYKAIINVDSLTGCIYNYSGKDVETVNGKTLRDLKKQTKTRLVELGVKFYDEVRRSNG